MYFPYVYMRPLMIFPLMLGSAAGIMVFSLMHAGLVAGATPGSIFAFLALTPPGKHLATVCGIGAAALVSFIGCSLLLKISPISEKDEDFSSSKQDVIDTKLEGSNAAYLKAKADVQFVNKPSGEEQNLDLQNINFIAFACDAGAGSSAMGATRFKKLLKERGVDKDIIVKHFSIENVPQDADIVIIQERLVERASHTLKQPIISIKNYIGDPKLDELIDNIKTALS